MLWTMLNQQQVATTYKEETAPVFNDDMILYQRTILHITNWKQHWQQQQITTEWTYI